MTERISRGFATAASLFALCATSTTWAADRSDACSDPPATQMIPDWYWEFCVDKTAREDAPPAGLRLPDDVVFGSANLLFGGHSVVGSGSFLFGGADYQLGEFILTTPGSVLERGPLELDGGVRVMAACDFRGNDFTTLYCLDTVAGSAGADEANLYRVETATGAFEQLASFSLSGEGLEGTNGLTYDPTTGKMFSVGVAPFFGPHGTLYELDLDALTLTQIGESQEGNSFATIAADNSGQLFSYRGTQELIAINKETAVVTVIGPLGFNWSFGQGMDFDASDNTCYLFAFNVDLFRPELRTCDTETGSTELVGVLGEDLPGWGHFFGAGIAAPGDCFVSLEVGSPTIRRGESLGLTVTIVHNRAKTVTVPFELSLIDESGNVVASRVTAPRTMETADQIQREFSLRVPSDLKLGSYTLELTVPAMEQDVALAKAEFAVVAE